MFLSQGREHSVPVGSTEVGWGPQGGDRILLGTDVLDLTQKLEESPRTEGLEATYKNVVHIVVLDLGGQINIDLNPVLRILLFDGV